MDATSETTQTTEVPDEHRHAVQFIRDAMKLDGKDWRKEAPTKNYCIAMAVKSGRESCGSTLGLKLREWVQTAPVYVDDQWLDDDEESTLQLVIDGKPIDLTPAETVPQTVPQTADPEQVVEPTQQHELPEAVDAATPAPEPLAEATPERQSKLRLLPPFASLGLSAVMQVIIVTDLLGHALDKQYDMAFWGYVIAFVFGAGIACALEGSAAYILDLYKKHLLAKDSTLTLRVLLLVYVGGSAAMIHWWTDERKLPWEFATVLSGLAASSIVLWMMGSKWANRVQMRENGQLDPALPRLATPAKFFHPVRWIQTIALTSWEPVQTTAEARERHAVWAADQRAKKLAKKQTKGA